MWDYCQTGDNAADLLTRGITPSQLQSSLLWSRGPAWLISESEWPKWSPSSILHIHTDEEEVSTIPVLEIATVQNSGVNKCFDITRYSKLTKLYRVTAYVLCFINNLKDTTSKMTGPLTATELDYSYPARDFLQRPCQPSVRLISLSSFSMPAPSLLEQGRYHLLWGEDR